MLTRLSPLLVLVGVAVLGALSGASAQPVPLPSAFEVAWTDVAPAVDAASDRVITSALGLPDERLSALAARRADARRRGETRARRALHDWLDASSSPRIDRGEVRRLHEAIDRHASVDAIRPLAEGGAVVRVAVSLEALRAASPVAARESSWSR